MNKAERIYALPTFLGATLPSRRIVVFTLLSFFGSRIKLDLRLRPILRKVCIDFGQPVNLKNIDALTSEFMDIRTYQDIKMKFIRHQYLVEKKFFLSGSQMHLEMLFLDKNTLSQWENALQVANIFDLNKMSNSVSLTVQDLTSDQGSQPDLFFA